MKININFLTSRANQLRDFILDFIFPIECLGCGRDGVWLCKKCFRKLEFKAVPYCLHCKSENEFGQFCPACRSQYALDGVWITGVYEEQIIAKLIKNLKYHFIQDIAEYLGEFLILFLRDLLSKSRISRSDLISGVDQHKFERISRHPNALLNFSQNLIIPVPLSNKRKCWRGFNQAEIIASVIADYFKLDLSVDRLIRVKHKKPQAKLGEAGRKNNIIGCFVWQGRGLAGRNVILVDDVVTTGSTLNECAKVLKDNGAGEVWGLVVAKG